MCSPTLPVVFCFATILHVVAADNEVFPTRAERRFNAAQEKFASQSTNIQVAIEFAHAAFEWAEFARKDSQRADIAQRGITAARQAAALDSANAAAHYWLAMNLGQLARTKSLGALKLVRDMESEFLRAHELDEKIDFAGPDRALGALYRDAPGWPTSVGSKKKAREYLERAVKIAGDFPENQLALLETYEKWGERENLERQLKIAQRTLADTRKKFKGEDWEWTVADWERRLEAIKSKTSKVGEP